MNTLLRESGTVAVALAVCLTAGLFVLTFDTTRQYSAVVADAGDANVKTNVCFPVLNIPLVNMYGARGELLLQGILDMGLTAGGGSPDVAKRDFLDNYRGKDDVTMLKFLSAAIADDAAFKAELAKAVTAVGDGKHAYDPLIDTAKDARDKAIADEKTAAAATGDAKQPAKDAAKAADEQAVTAEKAAKESVIKAQNDVAALLMPAVAIATKAVEATDAIKTPYAALITELAKPEGIIPDATITKLFTDFMTASVSKVAAELTKAYGYGVMAVAALDHRNRAVATPTPKTPPAP